jgi:3-phosphoglycerate kinase
MDPLGVFETKPFDEGTKAMAHGLANLDANVYIGGGDTGAAVNQANVTHKMTHVFYRRRSIFGFSGG